MSLFSFVGDALGGPFGDAPEPPDYSGMANANALTAQDKELVDCSGTTT